MCVSPCAGISKLPTLYHTRGRPVCACILAAALCILSSIHFIIQRTHRTLQLVALGLFSTEQQQSSLCPNPCPTAPNTDCQAVIAHHNGQLVFTADSSGLFFMHALVLPSHAAAAAAAVPRAAVQAAPPVRHPPRWVTSHHALPHPGRLRATPLGAASKQLMRGCLPPGLACCVLLSTNTSSR